MNTRLLMTAACIAALVIPSISLAQTQNAGTAPASVGSNSNSGATSQSNNANFNGGNGPITVGPTTVGPQTATSDSDSSANSLSGSVSRADGGQGGSSTATSNATGGTSSAVTGPSTATNGAANSANQQNITFNQTTPNKTKLETTPQVYAPALTTTLTETCMGSTSGGVSVMGFGGTLGTSWEDKQCIRRLNAREMAQTLGDRAAARALLCQDVNVAAAYAAVGQDCRQKYEVAVVVPPPAPISPVVINVPAPAAAPAPYAMPPVPNPPEVIYRDRPAHRSTHKNVPACKVDPHYACPAHDD